MSDGTMEAMTEPITEEQLTLEDLLGTVRGMMRFARIDGRALDLLEARIHALTAENERLREALDSIAEKGSSRDAVGHLGLSGHLHITPQGETP